MKICLTIASTLALLTSPAFAAEKIVKTCEAELRTPDSRSNVSLSIQFVIENGKLYSRSMELINGFSRRRDMLSEPAEMSEYEVREGLSSRSMESPEFQGMNEGEKIMAHAFYVSAHPNTRDFSNAGLDLAAVRFVRVYGMGFQSEQNNMGRSAVVEAKDARGNDLGSFLGGFFLAPCKN